MITVSAEATLLKLAPCESTLDLIALVVIDVVSITEPSLVTVPPFFTIAALDAATSFIKLPSAELVASSLAVSDATNEAICEELIPVVSTLLVLSPIEPPAFVISVACETVFEIVSSATCVSPILVV